MSVSKLRKLPITHARTWQEALPLRVGAANQAVPVHPQVRGASSLARAAASPLRAVLHQAGGSVHRAYRHQLVLITWTCVAYLTYRRRRVSFSRTIQSSANWRP